MIIGKQTRRDRWVLWVIKHTFDQEELYQNLLLVIVLGYLAHRSPICAVSGSYLPVCMSKLSSLPPAQHASPGAHGRMQHSRTADREVGRQSQRPSLLRRKADAAFTFVLQLMVPGPPHRALVIAWAADSDPTVNANAVALHSGGASCAEDDSDSDLSPFDLALARCGTLLCT